MRSRDPQRPSVASLLRPLLRTVLGAVMMLVALVWPQAQAVAASSIDGLGRTSTFTAGHPPGDQFDGSDALVSEDSDACGDDAQQELVECAGRYELDFGEPVLVTLMRALGVELRAEDCDELLRELWAEQSCAGKGPECGKINTGAPPLPAPKLASTSSSADTAFAGLDLGGAPERAHPRSTEVAALRSRDLQPPLPPPKLRAR